MAKQVIVLNRQVTETEQTFEVAFWFPVTSGQQATTSNSVWVAQGANAGASSAENTAIQNGSVKEEVYNFSYPVGESVTNIEADLLQRWTDRNNEINGVGPAEYYGAFYDPSAGGWNA